jgi:hypothetical protein
MKLSSIEPEFPSFFKPGHFGTWTIIANVSNKRSSLTHVVTVLALILDLSHMTELGPQEAAG